MAHNRKPDIMPKDFFQFKQFGITQRLSAMKVGIDGVLLGAWAQLPDGGKSILDVGTGTGLIALCMAQRYLTGSITAIELDASAAREAKENVTASPFADRINVLCADFTRHDFAETFDLIVSNPPYFSSGILSPLSARAQARHAEVSLSWDALLRCARNCLAPGGRIALVLPALQENELRSAAVYNGLGAEEICHVYTQAHGRVQRILCRLARLTELPPVQYRTTLTLCQSNGTRSEDYDRLTAPFYLD